MDNDTRKKELLDARLSDLEKENLKRFCQDEQMVHAVEKAMLYNIYMMGTVSHDDKDIMDVNWAFGLLAPGASYEEIGMETSKRVIALSHLDEAFKQIKRYGVIEPERVEEENPAR